MGPLLRCKKRGIGKRVERCQRTVLRGQQAPENRCRTQGLKRRRSGGRSSRRTSGTRMPRCRSGLPAARREHGRERRSFRAQRTGPTERARSPKCAAERAVRRTRRRNLSSVCSGKDGQFGSRQLCRDDGVGATIWSPRLRFASAVSGPQCTRDDHRGRPYSPPKDGPASISVCVRCRDFAVFDRAFPEAAAPRSAKASGRRIPVEWAGTVRYR